MSYYYISLPIKLASNELIHSISRIRATTHRLITYSVREDIMGFSTYDCPENMELICQSEEEFLSKVNQHRLLRML